MTIIYKSQQLISKLSNPQVIHNHNRITNKSVYTMLTKGIVYVKPRQAKSQTTTDK